MLHRQIVWYFQAWTEGKSRMFSDDEEDSKLEDVNLSDEDSLLSGGAVSGKKIHLLATRCSLSSMEGWLMQSINRETGITATISLIHWKSRVVYRSGSPRAFPVVRAMPMKILSIDLPFAFVREMSGALNGFSSP
ncbi:unnamed protein product [Peronospora farinosa]|uniref:Uncharacterized protein n=1 Tax=Peronospora farinosa TaxID=134698 RepID=A0AAV0TJL8_9STRA|nr:unnamed protein product [Peronospora farinosa]